MHTRLAGSIILLTVSLIADSAWAGPLTLYVSPAGRDTWSGRLPSANARKTDGPFASLEGVRDALRALKGKRGLPPGGVTVLLRDGTYRRPASFALTAEDSGTRESPISYRAYPGETVRLVGGPVIPAKAFAPVSDPAVLARLDESVRGKVLQADLRALGVTDLGEAFPVRFRGYAGWPELFFGSQPMTLARWPNTGFARVAKVVQQGSQPRYGETPDRPGVIRYDDDRPSRWLQADEVYLNGYWCYKWYNEAIRVARIDPAAKTITFAAPHMYGVGGPSGGEYYALNLLEELDVPGEYYVDRQAGVLYFLPPGPLAGQEIGLSLLTEPLVTMKDASHVTLRDLVFEFSRGMAVTMEGGSDTLIAGCTVRNIATDAVSINGGRRNGVVACEMYNMGGGGISLSGGDRPTLTPCRNFADNNHIHHYGRLFRTHRDAINLGGVGCRAAHNLIHDAPHHAMDFLGNDHLIEYNEIHHVCLETDDAGAIYTGRRYAVQGTVIRYNFFHHIGGGPSVGNQAIYLDDCASGTTCYGNVISQVYRAVLLGGGRDNIVRGNLIVDCPIPVHIDNRGVPIANTGDENWMTLTDDLKSVPYQGDLWRRRYPRLAGYLTDQPGYPKHNEVVSNAIVRCGPMYLADEARELGTVADNWETKEDPGVVDLAHLDFTLTPGTAALREAPGFRRIPFAQIGLRRDEYRRTLPVHAPWVEPGRPVFVRETTVTLGTRCAGAVIRYTLDGSEPGARSARYEQPLKLTRTATVKAVAFLSSARSDTVTSSYTMVNIGDGKAVFLSDLQPLEQSVHGNLGLDVGCGTPAITLQGKVFPKGLTTHPEVTPEGGKAHVTYALTGALRDAKRFRATVGVDDSAANAGSCAFVVEALRDGQWVRLFESPVLRGLGGPAEVDVDITGAEQLRLSTTDGGDGYYSDHAVWANARVE